MGLAGRLEGIASSDIFQIISQNRMTGTLIARCQEGTAMVIFKNGKVIEAASDAPQESLGHLLVTQGIVREETLDSAQDRRKREPDRPLGAILVEMGAISEHALEDVVLRQIGHIVHRLVSCEDGFFTFDSGEMALKRKLNTREFFLPSGVSAEYLMIERARTFDEERRSGADRRGPAPGPDIETEPAVVAAQDLAVTGTAAALGRRFSWFRGIRLPKTAEDVVRKGDRLVASATELVRRAVLRLKTALRKVRAFSPDGRALIYTGIAFIAAGTALMLLTTFSSRTRENDLVVAGRVANLRATPSTAAKVIAKTTKGETLSHISSAKGWHKVRTKAGSTGWIWEKLVEQKVPTVPTMGYAMTGFGLVLIAGLPLLIAGMMRKLSTP
jgi:hypothetical protein